MIAIFQCDLVTRTADGREDVRLSAMAGGAENREWADGVPAGYLTLAVTHAQAKGFFQPGQRYRIAVSPMQGTNAQTAGCLRTATVKNLNEEAQLKMQ